MLGILTFKKGRRQNSARLSFGGKGSSFEETPFLRGRPASVPKPKKSDNPSVRGGRYRESATYEEIQNALGECLTRDVSIVGISIWGVRGALDSEPDWSRDLDY